MLIRLKFIYLIIPHDVLDFNSLHSSNVIYHCERRSFISSCHVTVFSTSYIDYNIYCEPWTAVEELKKLQAFPVGKRCCYHMVIKYSVFMINTLYSWSIHQFINSSWCLSWPAIEPRCFIYGNTSLLIKMQFLLNFLKNISLVCNKI